MTCPNTLTVDLSKLSPYCYVEQIFTKCLAQYAYYIEADKKAIVIDPIRDVTYFTDILKSRDATLKYVCETHFHADFISGHVELANKTGAEIVFGPNAVADFKLTSVKHETILDLSEKIKLKVLHTPGHTLESSCFVLLEKSDNGEFKQLAVFTGDTLFLGDVGRPDLAVKSDLTSKDLANMLYDSIQLLKKLPDECVVLPGHGAGSACGKNIQTGSMSTISQQTKSNYALNENLKKEEFIEIVTVNIPTPPQYFFYDALCNKKSITQTEDVLKKCNNAIKLTDFQKILEDKEIVVIDSRKHSEIVDGFIKGTVCICLEMSYAIWTAMLYKPDTKIVLVTDIGKEIESITRLTRVGFENILGYLEGGYEAWVKAQLPVKKLKEISVQEGLKVISENPKSLLDIRNHKEYISPGYIKDSVLIPLPELKDNFDKIEKKEPLYILCKTGNRAFVTGSLLRGQGFENDLIVIKGGIDALIKEGLVPTPKKE